jgi:CheY-like chemotaxis protein
MNEVRHQFDGGPLELEEMSLPGLIESALEPCRAAVPAVPPIFNSFQRFPPMLLDPHRISTALGELLKAAQCAAVAGSGVDPLLAGSDEQAELIISWRDRADSPSADRPTVPRETVETHGGSLSFDAGPDNHYRLTLRLPVLRPAMQADGLDTAPHERDAASHLRVLLIEDSAIDRTLTSRMLERQGHSVTRVSIGEEALQAFLVGSFNLVLMDLVMPGVDGYAAAETIRRMDSGRGQRVPIFALSIEDLQENLQKCLDAGMDGMLNKPLRGAEFELLLKQLELEAAEARRRESTDGEPL